VVACTRRWISGAALIALLVASLPAPARAGTQTLSRAVRNILMSPLDVILSPVVATKALYTNWRDSDDTMAVKIVYPIPGWAWLTSVELGASVIRGISGAIELIPGLFLVPTNTELDPIYELPENREALVNWQDATGFGFKFGVDYVSPGL
jgi:hypothetical protein